MLEEMFKLVPQKYLCPICGNWHISRGKEPLCFYRKQNKAFTMMCNFSSNNTKILFNSENKIRFTLQCDGVFFGNRMTPWINAKDISDSDFKYIGKGRIIFNLEATNNMQEMNACKMCDEHRFEECVTMFCESKTQFGFEFSEEECEKMFNNSHSKKKAKNGDAEGKGERIILSEISLRK